MIKVLVVDDSTVVRKIIVGILNQHPEIKTITATNGIEALEKIESENPDVVTLDIDMPHMNGLETLRRIMASYPRPVIMLSAHTGKGTAESIQALEMGAVDCIPKINSQTVFLGYIETELLARILYFGDKRNYNLYAKKASSQPQVHTNTGNTKSITSKKVILIGASTGGPLVLQHILSSLSADFTGTIIIALHMPQGFSASFVERLDKLCPIHVALIQNNDTIEAKTIYVCSGGYQTSIEEDNGKYIFRVTEDTGKYPYKPSVDFLFSSVARLPDFAHNSMAIILTGMGHDGLQGCKELVKYGIPIYAQDETSSVVFGMPKAVLQANIATQIQLDTICNTIETFSK